MNYSSRPYESMESQRGSEDYIVRCNPIESPELSYEEKKDKTEYRISGSAVRSKYK